MFLGMSWIWSRLSDRAVKMVARANLGQSIGLLLSSRPRQGVCSASITTTVSTAGRIIAVCSIRGGSQVSQHSACCQRKTHWSLKVMKSLSQRPRFLLRSVPASTLNQSKRGDDPHMPASHSHVLVHVYLTKNWIRAACFVISFQFLNSLSLSLFWVWDYCRTVTV